jgi:hypothetical protein
MATGRGPLRATSGKPRLERRPLECSEARGADEGAVVVKPGECRAGFEPLVFPFWELELVARRLQVVKYKNDSAHIQRIQS